MKRIFTTLITFFIAVSLISDGAAKKKVKRKLSPCEKECQMGSKECLKEVKKNKFKDNERKKAMRECSEKEKECRIECNKPKEESED